LPACEKALPSTVGKEAGFSLHAGVAARAHECDKVERLCRYVSRPPVAEPRLSLTSDGDIRYRLKTPYRDGTTHVIFQPARRRLRVMSVNTPQAPPSASFFGAVPLDERRELAW